MKNYLAIPYQVPDFVRAEYPTFVEFLKAYYKWYQEEYLAGQSLEEIFDIDTAASEFIQYFRKQLDLYGITLNFDNRTYIKRLKEMYAAKGTTAGIQFLLQLVYGEGSVVSTPWDSVLKSSTGAWTQLSSIVITNVDWQGHTIDDFAGNLISFQTAPDENLDYRYYETFVKEVLTLPNNRYELFVTRFPLDDLLDSFKITIYDDIVTGSVYNSATSLSVTSGGSGFAVGQVFIVNGDLNSALNAGDNQITGDGIYLKVKDVSKTGSIKSLDIYQFGTGYKFNDEGTFTATFLPSDAEFTSASQSFTRKNTVEYSNCVAATTKPLAQYGSSILKTSTEDTIYLSSALDTVDGVTINKKWVVPHANFNLLFNRIVVPDHGFTTGETICYSSTTKFALSVNHLESGNDVGLDMVAWFVIVRDSNTIQLATSYENAIANIAIDLDVLSSTEDTSYFYKGFDRILVKNELPPNRNGVYQVSLDNKTLTRILTPSKAENVLRETPVGLHNGASSRTLNCNAFPTPNYLFRLVAATPNNFNTESTYEPSPVGLTPLNMTVAGNDPYTNSYNSAAWNFTAAAPGQTWTVSIWIKATSNTTAGFFLFGVGDSGVYIPAATTSHMFNVTTAWQQYSATVTLSHPDITALQIRVDGPDAGGTGIGVWYDGLQVTRTHGVNTSTNLITTVTDHGLETGNIIQYTANGTAITTPAGSLSDGSYYVITNSSTEFYLCETFDDVLSGNVLNLTGIGNPNHTFTVPEISSTLSKAKGSTVYITDGHYYNNTHWAQTQYVSSLNTLPITLSGEDFTSLAYLDYYPSKTVYLTGNINLAKLFVGQRVSGLHIPTGSTVTGWGDDGAGNYYVTINNSTTYLNNSFTYLTDVVVTFEAENFFNKIKWAKTSDVARLTFTQGSIRNYTGSYSTNYNVLGDSVPIQDSYYYQAYSYVTSMDIPLKDYAGLLRSTMHPAGAKHFGNYNLSYSFAPTIAAASELNIILNKDSIRDYIYAMDTTWRFDIWHEINPTYETIHPTTVDGNAGRTHTFERGTESIGTTLVTHPLGDLGRSYTLERGTESIGTISNLESMSFMRDMLRGPDLIPELGTGYNFVSILENLITAAARIYSYEDTYTVTDTTLTLDINKAATESYSVGVYWSGAALNPYVVVGTITAAPYWNSGYVVGDTTITN